MMPGYFDDLEEKEESIESLRVFMTREDYSGRIISSWTIICKIPNTRYKYVVRCKCNREYIRSINGILKGRSSKCIHCSKKNKMRWIPASILLEP